MSRPFLSHFSAENFATWALAGSLAEDGWRGVARGEQGAAILRRPFRERPAAVAHAGRPIFLKVVEDQGKKYPLFVKSKEGSVTPRLTLDDEGRFNQPVEKHIHGAAFVISEQGYLLTAKHMAAGWRAPFFDVSSDEDRHEVMVSATGDRHPPQGGSDRPEHLPVSRPALPDPGNRRQDLCSQQHP